jgi:hypothetical protein
MSEINPERRRLLTKAYSTADRELRKRHSEEFHAILAEVYSEMGIEVRKRLTGERKRKADIAALRERLASLEGSSD